MKPWITQIVITLLTSLLCNPGVLAGNTVVIHQSGGSASIQPPGHGNFAAIVQGQGPGPGRKISKQMRVGNRAVIQQKRDPHVARLTQNGTGHMNTMSEVGNGKK